MTLRVVGLDISMTCTGVVAADGTPSSVKPRSSGMPSRLDEIVRGVIDALRRGGGADVAAVEGYNPGGVQGVTMAKLGAARELVCWALWRDDILVADIPPSSLKLYATGKGNATKEQVLEAAVGDSPNGKEPQNFDEGDALWLRQMGLAWFEPLHPDIVEVSAEQHAALHRIRWPKLPARFEARPA